VQKAINILDGVSQDEKTLLEAAVKGLKGNIEKGVEFVKGTEAK
jgi:malate dehydrogenase